MATYLHLIDDQGIHPVPVPYRSLIMPGGEPFVTLPHETFRAADGVFIDARIGSMDDFGILLAVLDALSEIPMSYRPYLFIPYFPGARGDRVNHRDGTALAARMYAQALNQYDLTHVLVLDPHSDVTAAVVDNCTAVPITEVLALLPPQRWDAIVCPDQGAEKRTAAAAKALGIDTIIPARKVRDPATGALSGFAVDKAAAEPIVNGNPNLLIVDDICDGGGTFVGLAERLRADLEPDHGRVSIDLFVTHGIFSKGILAVTMTNGVNRVFTTDSFPRDRYYPLDGHTGEFEHTVALADLYPTLYNNYL